MVFVIPGGPWGVLLGSGEVWGGQWRGLGVPGRFQRCPRGLPNMTSFSFFGGEFAHGLMKYGHVRNGVILWSGRWSLCHATFLSFFEACIVAKQ